jgi:hypothetical protein
MDEKLNVGVVVVYRPGNDSIVRTNTRSLQNYVAPSDQSQENRIDGGTGIHSWLAPRPTSTMQVVAIKVIPQTSDRGSIINTQSSTPLGMAQYISEETLRAMTGSIDQEEQKVSEIVEQGDIISLAEAKKRTGYLESIGHSIKKLVWT